MSPIYGLLIGAWSYLFAGVFVYPKEVLGWYGRIVNQAIWSRDNAPEVHTIKGWRLFLYKYTYCPVCLSGVCALVLSYWSGDFYVTGAVSMITAKFLEKTL